jgi:[acyl-carrier-protein] S-malonyltransferase
MNRAIVFPGQGSQAIGMGRDLHDAFPASRAVFQEVDDALSEHLSQLMFEGEESELTLTRNAQPALMTVSMAVLRALEAEGAWRLADQASFVAGHSLGEYTALAAAGCLSVTDAARLLRRRGEAMQEAVPVGTGAMAALIGADLEQAEAVRAAAADSDVCAIANDNAPGQVVISGDASAIERAVDLAPEHGVKRAVMLQVSAPFHSPLLAPAAEVMAAAFKETTFMPLTVPLVANVTAKAVSDPADVRALLVEQVTAMVRWRESVLYMRDQGVEELVEIGAGKVLTGLTRRIDRALSARTVGAAADIEAFLAA